MNKQQIFEAVSEIFKTELNDASLEISLASTPSSIEAWDSINNLSIVNALEEKFSIVFSIDDIFRINSVNDICEFILGSKN